MNPRVWIAVACLVIGVPVAAWGLADGSILIGFAGLALVLAFVYLVVEALNLAARPRNPIVKADNPAWAMKDDRPAATEHESRHGGSL
ncbi:MAG TPA: hypothetical protein PLE54_03410 [Burkholderiaceae bacterium]|nr:hypothetical protein [Burkholderiaceae bacterium]HQR69625.1 hypothetical protein [Burkholderiaceae bacterium]